LILYSSFINDGFRGEIFSGFGGALDDALRGLISLSKKDVSGALSFPG